MKKKFIAMILALAMVLPIVPVLEIPVFATTMEFAGGSGTEADPYLIATKDHLNNVRNHLDAHYKMVADIVFAEVDFAEGGAFYNNGSGWKPISSFCGTFDGSGCSVKNLKISILSNSAIYAGLFSSNSGTISKVKLENTNILATSTRNDAYVGGIVAINNGIIRGCYVDGTLSSASNVSSYIGYGYAYSGGVVGFNNFDGGIIENCVNNSNVSANVEKYISYAGGIAGWNTGTISNCSNSGSIRLAQEAGGIVGYNKSKTRLFNCFNLGNVFGLDHCGGIVGENHSDISICYNSGAITTERQTAGGVVGFAIECKVSNSFNYGRISESGGTLVSVGGIIGGGSAQISNCYNAGDISSKPTLAGGIIGAIHTGGVISNCYYIDDFSKGTSQGTDSAISCSHEELCKGSTFIDFDFETIWEFEEGNYYKYPTLIGVDCFVVNAAATFNAGTGTKESPYYIATKNQLNNVRDYLGAHFKLIKDIVFSDADFAEGGKFYNNGAGWTPIAPSSANPFTGVFDGNNCTIFGLKITVSATMQSETRGKEHVGLFAYSKGSIKNLSVKDSIYTIQVNGSGFGDLYTGGVVGYQNGGEIANCSFAGNITTTTTEKHVLYTGGIVGYLKSANVSSCANKGHIFTSASNPHYTGSVNPSYTGGICGYSTNSTTIVDCCNKGLVEGGENSGGIAGYTSYSASIANCVNTGDVTGIYCVGGICGYLSAGGITKSYSTGAILSDSPVTANSTKAYSQAGGICGWAYQASISNCYNTGKVESHAARSLTISTAYARAGGIAGITSGTIEKSYNVGTIESDDYAAGICGNIDSLNGESIVNCYYIDTCQRGVYGVTDKTTKCTPNQMMLQDTFASFNFQNIWMMEGNEDYLFPELLEVEMQFAKELVSIEVTAKPDKLTYVEGEEFDPMGLIVTAYYNNHTSAPVAGYTISGYDSTIGTKNIIITYEGKTTNFTAEVETKYTIGDIDGNDSVDSDDAIYLLFHTLFEEDYPIGQPADFDKSGVVDSDDAIYLLFHTLFEEDYPL